MLSRLKEYNSLWSLDPWKPGKCQQLTLLAHPAWQSSLWCSQETDCTSTPFPCCEPESFIFSANFCTHQAT